VAIFPTTVSAATKEEVIFDQDFSNLTWTTATTYLANTWKHYAAAAETTSNGVLNIATGGCPYIGLGSLDATSTWRVKLDIKASEASTNKRIYAQGNKSALGFFGYHPGLGFSFPTAIRDDLASKNAGVAATEVNIWYTLQIDINVNTGLQQLTVYKKGNATPIGTAKASRLTTAAATTADSAKVAAENCVWIYSDGYAGTVSIDNFSLTKIIEVEDVPTGTTVLVDLDFEDEVFATTANTQNSWGTMYRSQGSDTNYTNMANWVHNSYAHPYYYVKKVTDSSTSNNLMRLDMSTYGSTKACSAQYVQIPFKNNTVVDSGTLTVEFDAALYSNTASTRLAFGLHDTAEAPSTKWNPWYSWADASLFAGLTAWSGTTKSLVAAYPDANLRAALPDCYLLADIEGTNDFIPRNNYLEASDWNSRDYVINNTFATANANPSSFSLTKFKLVIDLDNSSYKLYVNDLLKGTYPYLPGTTNGSYDAFVFAMNVTSNSTDSTGRSAGGACDGYLDNLKVTHVAGDYGSVSTVPVITVDGQELKSVQGVGFNSIISASSTFVKGESPYGAKIVLAAYKNGELVAVKENSRARTGILRVNARGYDGFAGADSVRAFFFYDDETGFKPITTGRNIGYYAEFYGALKTSPATCRNVSITYGDGTSPASHTTFGGDPYYPLIPTGGKTAYIKGDINDAMMNGLSEKAVVKARIGYWDTKSGKDSAGFAFLYQGTDGKPHSYYFPLLGTETYKTKTFYLYDASFANDCSTKKGDVKADFFIISSDAEFRTDEHSFMGTSDAPAYLWDVQVEVLEDTIAPFDITVAPTNPDKAPGNTFFYSDHPSFDIDYYDPSGAYTSGTAVYTVKDYNGATVITKTQTFSGGFDRVSFTYNEMKNKMGVYTMDISVTGADGISQTKTVDFAYAYKADNVSYRRGTNVHFDWNVYSKNDIKAITDLAKNAGFGMLRTKVSWPEIEPVPYSGQYSIPENILYGNQYADSQGLELLEIIAINHSGYLIDNGKYVNGVYQDDDGTDDWYNVDGTWYSYPWLKTEKQRTAYANMAAFVASNEGLGQYNKYFSIGNEFNNHGPHNTKHPYDHYANSQHYHPTYQYYVPIHNAAYDAIKAKNANAVIVSGEVGRFEDEWIDACIDSGMKGNVIAYHQYEYGTGPEAYFDTQVSNGDGTSWRNISPWKGLQQAYTNWTTGDNRRIWQTETGWASVSEKYGSRSVQVPATDIQVAKWLPRMFALYTYETDKIFNYAFTDNNLDYFGMQNNHGIINSHDSRTPFSASPAYITMAAYGHFTNGVAASAPTIVGTGDRRACGYKVTFKAAKYGDTIMAWRGDNASALTTTVSISGANTLTVYDMYGNHKGIINNGATITLTPEPVYIYKNN
ncbi:MAG: hypothetical protein IJF61_01680, partial [Clostridia bacterium]|nr:hypothetical protein [Clostridia bacterium]